MGPTRHPPRAARDRSRHRAIRNSRPSDHRSLIPPPKRSSPLLLGCAVTSLPPHRSGPGRPPARFCDSKFSSPPSPHRHTAALAVPLPPPCPNPRRPRSDLRESRAGQPWSTCSCRPSSAGTGWPLRCSSRSTPTPSPSPAASSPPATGPQNGSFLPPPCPKVPSPSPSLSLPSPRPCRRIWVVRERSGVDSLGRLGLISIRIEIAYFDWKGWWLLVI